MSQNRSFNPLAHSLAIASVAGTALLAGTMMTPVVAQNPAANKPPAAAAATSSKPETLDQRIQSLKTALQIKPDQESKWNAVAEAMRDNANHMEKLVAEKRKMSPEKVSAVDDLKTYEDFAQAHLDGIKHMVSPFKSLYDSMSAEQKKNADRVFATYGSQPAPRQG